MVGDVLHDLMIGIGRLHKQIDHINGNGNFLLGRSLRVEGMFIVPFKSVGEFNR